MAKQKHLEENTEEMADFNFDETATPDVIKVPIVKQETQVESVNNQVAVKQKPLINCLRNERVIVRYINRQQGIRIDNPKHIAYGGMIKGARKKFCVPMLESGVLVNVLTDDEKNYLEYIMGLEPNAMSIYKKPASQNFWSTANPDGISQVTLTKGDNILDLSNPTDYIKYKILLANKTKIAKSLQAYEDSPMVTYQFVIVGEGDETKHNLEGMNVTMRCYMLFGQISKDTLKLRTIVEILEGKPLDPYCTVDFLQSRHNELIQQNPKMYEKIVNDPLLDAKCLLKKAIEVGIVANRGNYLYLRDSNTPLCDNGQEPTLNIAAGYITNPKYQDIKYSIEAKIKALEQ